ncbi:hypothetical protein [Haloechinothrix sp. LS1_15]|uniref:hypothetical protein n=1 Tax=Haloechinothrix sp. LS1_15 TaxID=2652248 RepID=UPI00294B53C6|nr:hypothetical protein [Haloechinothrix sp. LS1_15]
MSRVAIVPSPPLLVPALVPGATGETAPVREAAVAAVRWLRAAADDWFVVGCLDEPGDAVARYGPEEVGTFVGYGADVPVALAGGGRDSQAGQRRQRTELPLPVLVTGWLRERAGAVTARVELLGAATSAADCAAYGDRLRLRADTAGLLVVGDGATCHGSRAPGGHDPRARGFDDRIAGALRSVDVATLLAIDQAEAAELGVTGRVPWQVAAGLAGPGRDDTAGATGTWRGTLLYSDAPFGVGYHVATWERV